jgi:hypothetical protein
MWLPFHPVVVLPSESPPVKKRKETRRQETLFRYQHKLQKKKVNYVKMKIKTVTHITLISSGIFSESA